MEGCGKQTKMWASLHSILERVHMRYIHTSSCARLVMNVVEIDLFKEEHGFFAVPELLFHDNSLSHLSIYHSYRP